MSIWPMSKAIRQRLPPPESAELRGRPRGGGPGVNGRHSGRLGHRLPSAGSATDFADRGDVGHPPTSARRRRPQADPRSRRRKTTFSQSTKTGCANRQHRRFGYGTSSAWRGHLRGSGATPAAAAVSSAGPETAPMPQGNFCAGDADFLIPRPPLRLKEPRGGPSGGPPESRAARRE